MSGRTPKDDWRDILARLRWERDNYAAQAAQWRKDAIELRKRRDWLGALKADDRASDYRKWRDERAAEAEKIRKQWHFK